MAKAITYNNAGVVEAIKRNSGSTKFYPASFQGIIQALDDWEGGSSGGGGGTNVLPENGDLPNTGNTEGDLVVIPNGDGDYFMYVFANGSWERLHITTEEVETAGSAPFALVTDDGVTVRNQKEINAYLDQRITTLSEKGYDDGPIREDLVDLEERVDAIEALEPYDDEVLTGRVDDLEEAVEALPVTVSEDEPEGEEGDLWFKSSGESLQLFVNYGGNWVVASPPVSTEAIESIATNAEATAQEARQMVQGVQFQLDQQVEFVRWDQQRQDGMIITLEEELEQLRPSIERGIWNFSDEDNYAAAGNFILVQEFLEEDAQEQLCTDALQACSNACDPSDVPCMTDCSREFDRCRSQIDGGKWILTDEWAKAESIGIAYEDALGTDHTFEYIEPDMVMDVFNVNDDGYMVGSVTKVNLGIDGVSIEFKLIQSRGKATGPVTMKFFHLDTEIEPDELTNFVRKTGDRMYDILKIRHENDAEKSGLKTLWVDSGENSSLRLRRNGVNKISILDSEILMSDLVDIKPSGGNKHSLDVYASPGISSTNAIFRVYDKGGAVNFYVDGDGDIGANTNWEPSKDRHLVTKKYIDDALAAPARLCWKYGSPGKPYNKRGPADGCFYYDDDHKWWRFSFKTYNGIDLGQTIPSAKEWSNHANRYEMTFWKKTSKGWTFLRHLECDKTAWSYTSSSGGSTHFGFHKTWQSHDHSAVGGEIIYVTVGGFF